MIIQCGILAVVCLSQQAAQGGMGHMLLAAPWKLHHIQAPTAEESS